MKYETMTQEQKKVYGFIKLTKIQVHIMTHGSGSEIKLNLKPKGVRNKEHLRLIVNN